MHGYVQIWGICHMWSYIWLQIAAWPPEMEDSKEVSKQDTAVIHR